MKKRSMILALASMLGISAAATAVSGFAWFTTQRTASISESTYKVGASQGSLAIAPVANTDINCETTVTGSVMGITVDSGELADVSSVDGKTFRKAVLNNAGTAVDRIENEAAPTPYDSTWFSEVNTSQMVCVSWSLELSNTNAGSPVDVYITNSGAPLFTTNEAGVTAEPETFKATASQTAFTLTYKASSVTSVTKNGAALEASAYSVSGKTFTLTSAADADDVIVVTYKADFSEFYRLAIIDNTTTVFMYGDAAHTHGMSSSAVTTDGLDGDTADVSLKSGDLKAINAASDADATTVAQNNQMLIDGLANGTNHTLKFVVWCEGTATPEAAVAANMIKTSFQLVAVTPAA